MLLVLLEEMIPARVWQMLFFGILYLILGGLDWQNTHGDSLAGHGIGTALFDTDWLSAPTYYMASFGFCSSFGVSGCLAVLSDTLRHGELS